MQFLVVTIRYLIVTIILRVLYFANFCDLEKFAKLSTRKNFYRRITVVYVQSQTV